RCGPATREDPLAEEAAASGSQPAGADRRGTARSARRVSLRSGLGDEEVELVLEPIAAAGGAVRRERLDDLSPYVRLARRPDELGDAGGRDQLPAELLVVRVLVRPRDVERGRRRQPCRPRELLEHAGR